MENHSSKSILSITLLLITISGCSARPGAASTNTEFIRTSCSATAYPALCYSSLSSHAALIQQNHKLLAGTALSLSLDTTRSTAADMAKLSRAAGMTPREAAAMKDCVEVLADSVDELKKSMDEMKGMKEGNFGMVMSDIQTWVSAALTDEETCMDGFEGTTAADGGVEAAVREKVVKVAHMTSNALALINTYASLHG